MVKEALELSRELRDLTNRTMAAHIRRADLIAAMTEGQYGEYLEGFHVVHHGGPSDQS